MSEKTYVACLTPPGRSAIAALAIRGPRAWDVVRPLFRFPSSEGPEKPSSRELPASPQAGSFWFGLLGEEGKGGFDQVVLAVRRSGLAPWLEVHCHGGPEVIKLVEETLQARGLEACTWAELARMTGSDPLENLAQEILVRAPTIRTAGILLDQFQGAFHRAVELACGSLRENNSSAENRQLRELAECAPLGRHLVDPWRLVLAGPANVGKSSLANALAGYTRSVVAPTPGTTRDLVTITLAIDGWPVELSDTAGWRQKAEGLEGLGIARAREAAAHADLCLWLLDGSTAPVFPDILLPRLRPVITKTDRPPGWDWTQVAGAIKVSAHTRFGLEELCTCLSQDLVPYVPAPGAAVPFTPELCTKVEEAWQHYCQAQKDRALQILEDMLQGTIPA